MHAILMARLSRLRKLSGSMVLMMMLPPWGHQDPLVCSSYASVLQYTHYNDLSGHELHGRGLRNKSNAKFSAYIAAEKLDEDGNPAVPPKPRKCRSKKLKKATSKGKEKVADIGDDSSEYTGDSDGFSEVSDDSDSDVGITNKEVCIISHITCLITDFYPAC